jgi:hypothetical protein
VTDLADAGPGSLRQALLDTPAGGTVDFQPGLSGTITLTSGELAIAKDLTVSGPGSSVITVSGNHASRVFDIAATFSVSIAGLTIADGFNGLGGGIFNAGVLTVTDSTLSGNGSNFFGTFGGGIYNQVGGTLTVTGSTLSGNTAAGGGGIFNGRFNGGGTVTVTGSTLSGNTAFAEGGGIENAGTVTVTGSTLSGNTTAGLGGGIDNVSGTLTVTDSTLSGNSATNGGGGIFNSLVFGAGTLTVTGSTLSDNSTGAGVIGGDGGGIFNAGVLTVTNSTFSGNSATSSTVSPSVGGGILNSDTLTITGSTLSGNSASGGGGGIYNDGTLTVTDSTLSANTAFAEGGGIDNTFVGTLTVTDSTLSGNSAGTDGGGVWNGDTGTLTVTDSTLSGNSAGGAGSGIYNAGLFAVRGLVTIDGDYFQTATGTLGLRIGGLQAGTEYDQLVVNGFATLDGTLQLNLVNGFVPQSGDRFQPLLFGSGSGTFAHYTGDVSGFSFLYVYDDNGFLPPGLILVAN